MSRQRIHFVTTAEAGWLPAAPDELAAFALTQDESNDRRDKDWPYLTDPAWYAPIAACAAARSIWPPANTRSRSVVADPARDVTVSCESRRLDTRP